jgi:hypothetical protein
MNPSTDWIWIPVALVVLFWLWLLSRMAQRSAGTSRARSRLYQPEKTATPAPGLGHHHGHFGATPAPATGPFEARDGSTFESAFERDQYDQVCQAGEAQFRHERAHPLVPPELCSRPSDRLRSAPYPAHPRVIEGHFKE